MPDKKLTIIPFQKALSDLLKWLKDCPVVIIGGVAVSLLGRPRHTQDIDALILLDNEKWEELLAAAEKYGFSARINDVIGFARKRRVLLMRHKSGIGIDISFGALPFEEECLSRCKKVRFADIKVPIPTPEDLIIMKAVAHRPVDLEDIRNILISHPKLDISRIKYWLQEFAKVLEMPEIWGDIAIILKSRKHEA